MTDLSRWPDADAILDEALDLPPHDRKAFVRERAAGDRALADALEAVLLEAEPDGFLPPGGALDRAAAADVEQALDASGAALDPGELVGAYRIIEELGRGGMGQVYRARDLRLNRDVAIKVLPGDAITGPERLARFDREARVLALLSHPRIGAIYDLVDVHGRPALVLELVEGPTLADRLAQGPLTLEETSGVAARLVEGLEAAHRQGIVHRDLKPANIKVADSGAVKILDFGLAKAFETDERGASSGAALDITGSVHAVLGTAAYMSPEQARGQTLDHRTDIWAFGCIVYEMLTGERAFAGETTTDVIAAVLERDPDFSRLPTGTPPAVRRLLERCLRKDASRRLGYIGDAVLELEDARSEATSAVVVSRPPAASARGAWGLAAAATVLGLAAGGITAFWATRPDPPSPTHLAVPLGAGDELVTGALPAVALAPDGRTLVYRAERDGATRLVRYRLDGEPPAALPGTIEGIAPFFSPDGRSVGFEQNGRLSRVPVDGGDVREICAAPGGATATWGPDGTIVFASGSSRILQRVADAGGEPEPLTALDPARGEIAHETPHFLPGGDALLFTLRYEDRTQVALLDLARRETTVLTEGANPQYIDGWVVFVRGRSLWAAPLDGSRRALAEDATVVLQGLEPGTEGLNAHYAIGSDGTLIYIPERASPLVRRLLWIDREGFSEAAGVPDRAYTRVAVSPDGERLAVAFADGGASDIWVFDRTRGTLSRVTFFDGVDTAPVWTPDGQAIVFRSDRDGGGLFQTAADGTGDASRITSPEGVVHTPYDWTPDGEWLVFSEFRTYVDQDIGMVHLETGEIRWLVNGLAAELRPQVSPDGRWLAYQSDATSRFEVYVSPLGDPEAPGHQVTTEGGTSPLWGRGGRELYFHDGRYVRAVDVADAPALTLGAIRTLFEHAASPNRLGPTFDALPSGEWFIVIAEDPGTGTTASGRIAVIQAWSRTLGRKTDP